LIDKNVANMFIASLHFGRISVLQKCAARTCAIIRVWEYPNKPEVAKVVPIRIGTLLAKFWNRPSGHCLPGTGSEGGSRKKRVLLRVCPASQVLKTCFQICLKDNNGREKEKQRGHRIL